MRWLGWMRRSDLAIERLRYVASRGRRPTMPDRFEQPILNAPDECPARHWELDNQVTAHSNEDNASAARKAVGAAS